jgi:hypothetical protein
VHETTQKWVKPILIKFGIGEFYEKLSGHFDFVLNQTGLVTIIHKRKYRICVNVSLYKLGIS